MCSSTILTIFGIGLVLEQQHALHRQIRRVDLQDISGIDHGFILVMHLARDGVEIVLIGRVMRIEHRAVATMPGEGSAKNISGNGGLIVSALALETRELDLDGFLVGIFDSAIASGQPKTFPVFGIRAMNFLREQRKLDPLAAERPLRFAAEPGHALG